MSHQLVLLEMQEPAARLDERTREVGRLGLQEARRALSAAPCRATS